MSIQTLLDGCLARLGMSPYVISRSWSETPYLVRWALLGEVGGGRPAVYLHRFISSDADDFHDHPWPFVSVILAGGYWEVTPHQGRRWYGPGRILVRPARWAHRIELPKGREAWTLVFHGRKIREWGFWCPNGWRPWREHLRASELTGSGCG